jgi:hypothetical protein
VVPRGQSNEAEWHPLGEFPVVGTLYVKEKWERDPLRLRIAGDRVSVDAHVRYRARIAERACLPRLGCRWVTLASCGHGGPMATLDLGLRTTVAWRPDWTVVPRTRPRPVDPGVRCKLTRANVDVTERVREMVQKQLDRAAPRVDEEIRQAVALRRRVEDVWGDIQEPIRADDSVYLVFRPDSVAVAPPVARGARVSTTVSVRVRPKVVIGPEPQLQPLPLPDYGAALPGDSGFRVTMQAELPFTVANQLLQSELLGKSITYRDHTVRVKGVRLYAGGSRVVMEVKVGGDARGTLYFVGTPVFNARTRELSVPNLDFSVETRHALGEAAEWLLHDEVRQRLAAAARFPVGDRIDKVHQDVNKAINRSLSRAVRLSGTVTEVRPRGVVVTPRAVAAVVEADGRVQIDITVR